MTESSIEYLNNKCLRVINSCKTMSQLHYAQKFVYLAYKEFAARKYTSLQKTTLIASVESELGVKLCEIKHSLQQSA
jgi:hypothetical protein